MEFLPAKGLASVTTEGVATAFQVTESNPMVGLEGRTSLLVNLSKALSSNPVFFGHDARPGNIVGEEAPQSIPGFHVLTPDIRFSGERIEGI